MAMSIVDEDDLPPLKISCTSSDCAHNRHCFRETKKMAPLERGSCRYCGANLVDWDRVHAHDLSDVSYTFEALRYEHIRHHFWHVEIDQKAMNHARRKGKLGMRQATERRIRSSVGRAQDKLFRDGTQTPTGGGNILFDAQHATASCCRTCMEEWHGIPRHQDLQVHEIAYLVDLAMLYVEAQLPDLNEHGVKVPSLRREKGHQEDT